MAEISLLLDRRARQACQSQAHPDTPSPAASQLYRMLLQLRHRVCARYSDMTSVAPAAPPDRDACVRRRPRAQAQEIAGGDFLSAALPKAQRECALPDDSPQSAAFR